MVSYLTAQPQLNFGSAMFFRIRGLIPAATFFIGSTTGADYRDEWKLTETFADCQLSRSHKLTDGS